VDDVRGEQQDAPWGSSLPRPGRCCGTSRSAPPASEGRYFCGVLWASANGHELWTQCGTRQLVIVGGNATRTRLAWLLRTNTGSGASVFAW